MKKQSPSRPRKIELLYLRFAFFLTLLLAIALLISYLDARTSDPVAAVFTYAPYLEYLFASLFLTLLGAFLLKA